MLAEVGRRPPPFALRDQNDQNATPLEDKVVGDPVVLIFDRSLSDSGLDDSTALLRALVQLHHRLAGQTVTIYVLSQRAMAENVQLAQSEAIPYHLLTDAEGEVFQAYGIEAAPAPAFPAAVVLDANGRVVLVREDLDTATQIDQILTCLQTLKAQRPGGALGLHPPVLVIPNALDAEMCARLIETWDRPVPLWEGDGKVSEGFNVEKGDFKVRNDRYGKVVQYIVRDADLMGELDRTLMPRVGPEIEKAFGYKLARREQYRIAGYDSVEGGGLPPHRDNPTEATKHRRFTISVNLNNDSFEGGELAFRESSDHLYDVPAGTAIVWSASVLHEVLPVTSGRRFILGAHLYG